MKAPWSKPIPDRVIQMSRMFEAGSTYQQIGEYYGVSRQCIQQTLARYFGTSRECGGQHKKAVEKRSRVASLQEAACLQRHGLSLDEWRDIRRIGREMLAAGRGKYQQPLYAFRSQRNAARFRRVEWRLTLGEWWQIWSASGKWDQRGRGQGYVMCRHGDVGPYAVGNVFIARAIENSSIKKGHRASLPIGVTARGRRFIAKRMFDGKTKRLGSFESQEMAALAYVEAERAS